MFPAGGGPADAGPERAVEEFDRLIVADVKGSPAHPLFDDLGTPRWVRTLGKAPAAIWSRFAWGWLRPAYGRRSPS